MDRLTKKGFNFTSDFVKSNLQSWSIAQALKKLQEYEDLEEQGKLLKLSCAVGDTVYVKMQIGGYAEAEVRDFTYFLTCGFCIVVTSDKFDKQNIPFSEFGKSVFLTREEAEVALRIGG